MKLFSIIIILAACAVTSVAAAKEDVLPFDDNIVGVGINKEKDEEGSSNHAGKFANNKIWFPELGGVFLLWQKDVARERNESHDVRKIGHVRKGKTNACFGKEK